MIINLDGRIPVLFADNGLAEAVSFLDRTPRRWSYDQAASTRASERWDFSAGYAGALRLAKDGWSKGSGELSALLSALPTDGHAAKTRMDVAGERPDIGRYLAGEPAHMSTRGRAGGKDKIVHLVVQTNFSASVSAESIRIYGACMAAIVDKLENSGRRVELDAVQSSKSSVQWISGWKVKRAAEPLNMSDVAFSISHPAAFRRIAFGLWERTPRHVQSGNYGIPQPMKPEHLNLIDAEGAFLIPAIPPTATGMRDALRQAIAQVNKAAGEELLSCD